MSLLEISLLLLWILVAILSVVLFVLVRQVGVLHERIAPAGALMLNQKLRPGDAAPRVEVRDLNGERQRLGGDAEAPKSCLLYFLSPDCPICKSLLSVVKSIASRESSWLEVVLASDGADLDHRGLVGQHHLETFRYVLSETLGRSYGIAKLPYAVLIDESGRIVSFGIVNSREHLESLFESKERKVASIQDYLHLQQDKYDNDQMAG